MALLKKSRTHQKFNKRNLLNSTSQSQREVSRPKTTNLITMKHRLPNFVEPPLKYKRRLISARNLGVKESGKESKGYFRNTIGTRTKNFSKRKYLPTSKKRTLASRSQGLNSCLRRLTLTIQVKYQRKSYMTTISSRKVTGKKKIPFSIKHSKPKLSKTTSSSTTFLNRIQLENSQLQWVL